MKLIARCHALPAGRTRPPRASMWRGDSSTSCTPAPSSAATRPRGRPCTNSAPPSIGPGHPSGRCVSMRPPMRARASSTITDSPACTSRRAASSPATPAPTTTTSASSLPFMFVFRSLGSSGHGRAVSQRLARAGARLPQLRPVGPRDADRFRRRAGARDHPAGRRAAGRPGRPPGAPLRGTGGTPAANRARAGRHRSRGHLRDERREALQVGGQRRARQAAHSPEAEHDRGARLPALAARRDRGHRAARDRVPGRDRGAVAAGERLPGDAEPRQAPARPSRRGYRGDGPPGLDPARQPGRARGGAGGARRRSAGRGGGGRALPSTAPPLGASARRPARARPASGRPRPGSPPRSA